jgi:hypothetical protein
MRDDNLLADRDWMHFLGVGKLQHGCVYTTIQRQVRESINPNFTISYDVSSPFTLAAYGKIFLGYNLSKNGWAIRSEKLDGRNYLPTNIYIDDEGNEQIGCEMVSTGKGRVVYKLDEEGNKINLPPIGPDSKKPFLDAVREMYDRDLGKDFGSKFVETEVGKILTMGDVCINVDPKYTSTWDVVTYALMMNHNTQIHMDAVFEAQDLYDSGDLDRVPSQLLELKEVIEEAFKVENRYDFLIKHRPILNHLATEAAMGNVMDYTTIDMEAKRDYENSLKAVKEYENSLTNTKNLDVVKLDFLEF